VLTCNWLQRNLWIFRQLLVARSAERRGVDFTVGVVTVDSNQYICRPRCDCSRPTIGILFSAWQATTQALQPMQVFRSIDMPTGECRRNRRCPCSACCRASCPRNFCRSLLRTHRRPTSPMVDGVSVSIPISRTKAGFSRYSS